MTHALLPAVWLIVLLCGLAQFTETVYSPSLPDIAVALHTSGSMAEYTLTIYLFGFALGTLFWGKLSDRLGRKPCVLAGLLVFMVGCLGCYVSESITVLMLSRLIQAFGGSIGSVLGQAICRDAFHGPALAKVYASIGSALAIFPAIGPVIGGFIAEGFGWRSIFIVLIIVTVILGLLVFLRLPETHHVQHRKPISILTVALRLVGDKKAIGYGLIVGGCNGIAFSYFAEGSFYLIKLLGLSPSQYGLSFMVIALGAFFGGVVSKKLHQHHIAKTIIGYGLWVIVGTSILFSSLVIGAVSAEILIYITIFAQMSMMFGICMVTSNALALSLVDYKDCIGTASSLFGFYYYCVISLCTLGMGALHNDTLFAMPLYFLAISLSMLAVKQMFLTK